MDTNYGYQEMNLIRSFPFVECQNKNIPDWLVVDFRAIVLDGDFDPSKHKVWLAWVGRLATKIRLGFRTDAPELKDEELIFEFDLNSTDFQTRHVNSQPLVKTLAERCGCADELLCDPDFNNNNQCGPEQLCDPAFALGCDDNLLCDIDQPPLS